MLFLEKKNEPVQSAYYIHVNVQRHCCSLDLKCCPPHSYVKGWSPANRSDLSDHSDRVDLNSHYLIDG